MFITVWTTIWHTQPWYSFRRVQYFCVWHHHTVYNYKPPSQAELNKWCVLLCLVLFCLSITSPFYLCVSVIQLEMQPQHQQTIFGLHIGKKYEVHIRCRMIGFKKFGEFSDSIFIEVSEVESTGNISQAQSDVECGLFLVICRFFDSLFCFVLFFQRLHSLLLLWLFLELWESWFSSCWLSSPSSTGKIWGTVRSLQDQCFTAGAGSANFDSDSEY